MTEWNPVTHPYRVTWHRHAPAPIYWLSRVETHETEAAARERLASPMLRGEYECIVDVATNLSDFRAGGWREIARRRRTRKAVR